MKDDSTSAGMQYCIVLLNTIGLLFEVKFGAANGLPTPLEVFGLFHSSSSLLDKTITHNPFLHN